VSEAQTLRNEDNAFLPLSSGQISQPCEFCQSNKALCQAAEKTLKQHTWVSSPLQVRLSLMFNCGIRADLNSLRAAGPLPSLRKARTLLRALTFKRGIRV